MILVVVKLALIYDLWSNLSSNRLNLNFKSHELANAFTSLILGLKLREATHIKHDINTLHLWNLFGENGLHYFLLIQTINFYIPSLKIKRFSSYLLFLLCLLTLSPSLIRLFLFKTFQKICKKYKLNISLILILFMVFILSFFMGHFANSPIGFIFSFCFWFSFLWARNKSRIEFFLLLSLLYSLIAIYFLDNFSFISILCSLLILWIYIKFYRFLLLTFLFCLIIKKNYYLELMMKIIFTGIHFIASNWIIDYSNSTLLIAVLIFLALISKRPWLILLYLIFHIDIANTPTISLVK